MRTINVTAGAKEYLTAVVTETTGADLAAATFEVALGSSRVTPPTTGWQAPDATERAGAVVRTSLLVDDVAQIGNPRWLWVRVTDSPELIPIACSERAVAIV